MADKSEKNSTAVLVGIDFGQPEFKDNLDELCQLTESANAYVTCIVTGRRNKPDGALYAGSGKIEEIRAAVLKTSANVVIFNHDLTPAQERNLVQSLQVEVLDRTGLILQIFAQRAKSYEGKLQVELAQLERASTRLIRGWSHLERQRGGKGFIGGMGETQLEIDRRLINRRTKSVKNRLVALKKQRSTQRRSRERAGVYSVSLIGYTNAGKSTLFTRLTNSDSFTADQLFATLDTTTRKVKLTDNGKLVLSDTVGFIRNLPHTLVDAFRSTLQETLNADLLLHVVDCANDRKDSQIAEVAKVLGEIGASKIDQILVLNKVDSLKSANEQLAKIGYDDYGRISVLHLSAKTGQGVEKLRQVLAEFAMAKAAMRTSLPMH